MSVTSILHIVDPEGCEVISQPFLEHTRTRERDGSERLPTMKTERKQNHEKTVRYSYAGILTSIPLRHRML